MKVLLVSFLVWTILLFISCSEDSPQQDVSTLGKLFIESIPSGATIYLMGNNTGSVTPATMENLEPGTYSGFIYKEYYDTVYFSANVTANTTTSLDFALEDALPVVDIEFDYYTIFSGDSVKFDFTVNQDVLMDSILIARPADSAGTIITDVFDYDDILFQAKDQFGANIIYYLPPHGSASEYFPRIRGAFYYFRIVGKKAYGAQVEFRILYQIGL